MTLPTRRSFRTSAALLLASALLLAGCGDGDDGKDGDAEPRDDASSASSSATTDPGATDSATGSSDGSAGGQGDTAALTTANFYDEIIRAQQDAGSYRSRSTTSTAGMKAVLEGEATYVDGELLGHAESAAGNPQQIETVVAGGVLYLRAEGMGIPAGKWLAIDSNDPDQADSPLAGLAAVADPERALEAMGELDSLELVGPETVEGVRTNHYRATMSTDNYAKVLGLPADAAELLPPQLPFDMWIDDENRPVRFTLEFEIDGTRSTSEQTYFDYGADIDVKVPPASSTVSPSDIGGA